MAAKDISFLRDALSSMTREEIRERGAAFQSAFFGEGAIRENTIPGDGPIRDELDFGLIRARDGLEMQDKAIVALAVSSALQRLSALPSLVRAGLHVGLDPRAILEIFLQTSLYAGFVTAESSTAVANQIFAERGLTVDDATLPFEDSETMLENAGAVYSDLLNGAPDMPRTEFPDRMYPAIVAYSYGACYRGKALSTRQRMTILVACMTALGSMDDALPSAFISAINVEISIDEIAEIVIQTAPYAGTWRVGRVLFAMEQVFPGGKLPAQSETESD